MSFRLRLILTFALLMALSFSSIIWLIINDVRPRYLEAVEESTVDTAEIIAAILSGQVKEGRLSVDLIKATMDNVKQRKFAAHIYNFLKTDVSLRIYVTDAKGILLYDSTNMAKQGDDYSRWRDVYLTLRGQYGARSTRTIADAPSSQVLFVAAPILKNSEIVGVVSVGKPTNSISFLIAIAQKRFLLSLMLIAGAAIALSIGLSCWITRPVQRLTQYATAIRKGETQRLPNLGSSEIRDLGTAMEEMQAKLEGKEYIEDYVRALTHELKSPLTGIRGAGEILRDHIMDQEGIRFLNIVETEVGRLHRLVDRMLQLSRLENVRSINKTTFSAELFFLTLANSFQTQLAAKDLRMENSIAQGLALEGDELLLQQAIGNLIANAVDFSPQGSVISISAGRTQQTITIVVRDQGCGMPDFALAKAFQKFFSLSRPDSGQKSTGLGLPFVAEVLSRHGGTIRLANISKANPGVTAAIAGLEATVELPG